VIEYHQFKFRNKIINNFLHKGSGFKTVWRANHHQRQFALKNWQIFERLFFISSEAKTKCSPLKSVVSFNNHNWDFR
jgi:hypothetical protein